MKQMFVILMGSVLLGLAAGAQQVSSAEALYQKACAEREAGDAHQAIQTAAQIVALHVLEAEWVAKSDLLCAELYLELGLLDSAEATVRQIELMHANTEVAAIAKGLIEKIEDAKKGAE